MIFPIDENLSLLYNIHMKKLLNIEERVTKFLQEFDFSMKFHGTRYLKDMIIYALEINEIMTNVQMYNYVADHHNTDPDNIDRCLRTLVDKKWRDLAREGLFEKRPTNREFVTTIIEYIKFPLDRKSVYDVLTRRI